jgi:putative transposase
MGRQIRRDFDGAWHHVMNRGASHQRVFFSAADARAFLRLLEDGHERHGIEIHAYCLMTNHFHLLVRCPEGQLSNFMHRVGTLYTKRINAIHGRDGSLFRSRFHSIVVDSEEYVSTVARYIHRNPIELKPPVALDRYRWSSLPAYLGTADQPSWLATSRILCMHETTQAYADYVMGEHRPGHATAWELQWVVSVLVDQIVDDSGGDRTRLTRAALLGTLDRATGDQEQRLRTLVEFPSEAARRQALYRARSRAESKPGLDAVVSRALDLTA